MTAPAAGSPARRALPLRRVVFLALVGVLVALVVTQAPGLYLYATMVHRTTPVYDPPVLAGQYMESGCSGGVYARTADGAVVLTTTGHCLKVGQQAYAGGRLVGVASAPTGWAVCDRPGKDRCTASDMAYLTLEPSMIPWGHLDQVDMGAGGYVTISPGTRALRCEDVRVGDHVAFDGHAAYRTGEVTGQQANDFPQGDGTYFPCITITTIKGWGGDSGGIVLAGTAPAGVASRVFGPDQLLGFTPLAPGLEELGLTMCDTPDCGLTPETAANR